MNSLEKEFTLYPEALALKELGFDEPCFGWLFGDGSSKEPHYEYSLKQDDIRILAPTYSQAFRWFREKYQLKVSFPFWNGYSKMLPDNRRYSYECIIIPKNGMSIVVRCKNTDATIFKVYEEAELACLRKLIEIVKAKQ